MKILFVSTKGPLPTNDGHSLRTYNLLKALSNKNEIHLISFVKFKEEYDHIKELNRYCSKIHFFDNKDNTSKIQMIVSVMINIIKKEPYVAQKYYQTNVRNTLSSLVKEEKYDAVHIDMLPLFCYYKLFKEIPIIYNAHNIESELVKRTVENEKEILKKLYLKLQYHKLRKFENNAFRLSEHVAVCSSNDANIGRKISPKTSFSVVANGVDVNYFRKVEEVQCTENALVFVGGLNWYPNFDGLKWFDKKVMPIILQTRPDTKLHIIGRDINSAKFMHSNNIIRYGYVTDIRKIVSAASVFIVPLKIGGGTRLKILDAMSMEKAIVSTDIGAEGLNVENYKSILIANSANDFANKILMLLDNTNRREAFGKNARYFVEKNYTWEQSGKALNNIYKESVGL